MAADSFERTSPGWQGQKWFQSLTEWIELQLSNINLNGVDAPSWSIPDWVGRTLFWLLIIVVLIWVSWLLSQMLSRYTLVWRNRSLQAFQLLQSTEPQTVSDSIWLLQARAFEQQGQYQEACRCLYMAALTMLSNRQVIPAKASRTDGEYLQQVADLAYSQPYQLLISTHEQSHFGNLPISAEIFEGCKRAYQEIEQR